MSGRGGFALIAVLWVTAALGLLTTVGLSEVEVARLTAENRLLERRAFWAARACVEVAWARQVEGEPPRPVERVELGRGVACEATWVDPHERVNPNHADSAALARILRDGIATAALLDWMDGDGVPRGAGAEAGWYRAHGLLPPRDGPLASVQELLLIRGFEGRGSAWLDRMFTVAGDGRIDPNRAPREVLETLSMLSRAEATRIVQLRRRRPLEDAEEVMNAAGARLGAQAFRALAARLVFDPPDHRIRVVGHAAQGDRAVGVTLEAELTSGLDGWALGELRIHP